MSVWTDKLQQSQTRHLLPAGNLHFAWNYLGSGLFLLWQPGHCRPLPLLYPELTTRSVRLHHTYYMKTRRPQLCHYPLCVSDRHTTLLISFGGSVGEIISFLFYCKSPPLSLPSNPDLFSISFLCFLILSAMSLRQVLSFIVLASLSHLCLVIVGSLVVNDFCLLNIFSKLCHVYFCLICCFTTHEV